MVCPRSALMRTPGPSCLAALMILSLLVSGACAGPMRVARWQNSPKEVKAGFGSLLCRMELEFAVSGGPVRGKVRCQRYLDAQRPDVGHVHEHDVTGGFAGGSGLMEIKVGPGSSRGCSWSGRVMSGNVDPSGAVRLYTATRQRLYLATFDPFASSGPPPPAKPRTIGRVVEMRGQIVVTDASGKRIRLSPGMDLPDGADVATGSGSSLVVQGVVQGEECRMRVGPETNLHCVATQDDNVRFRVTFGEVTFTTEKSSLTVDAPEGLVSWRLLDIETPHAVLRPTGTDFTVRCDRNATRVVVREGAVTVALTSGARGQVAAGQVLELSPESVQVEPRPAAGGSPAPAAR